MSARSLSSVTSVLFALALSPLAVACAVSDAAPPSPSAPTAQPASAAPDVCVQALTRARICTAQWIPALVDTRARLDAPAGIAAAVREDRAGVIAAANAEWATDSQDANIADACAHMATTTAATDRTDAAACLAKAGCDDYVACAMPVFARHLGHL